MWSFRSLNPCFNGIWSARDGLFDLVCTLPDVLILVLMEYGLRDDGMIFTGVPTPVLILVLMEYGLRVDRGMTTVEAIAVLILVLMEYGLRVCSP